LVTTNHQGPQASFSWSESSLGRVSSVRWVVSSMLELSRSSLEVDVVVAVVVVVVVVVGSESLWILPD